MKAVILAGGLGTRLAEETGLRPKPMVEIGDRPIIWHIMKTYLSHGVRDFIICCGYKGYVIKEYFANYRLHMTDITVDGGAETITYGNSAAEDWRITLVDTGDSTMTGGRLGRVRDLLAGEDAFCLTYGDGVGDIDITALIAFHRSHGGDATVTAVRPPSRFGALELDGDRVTNFAEKLATGVSWINGGFFVFGPRIFDLVNSDEAILERAPLEQLAHGGALYAFKHHGFWQPMDTLRDRHFLEAQWASGKAPWKTW